MTSSTPVVFRATCNQKKSRSNSGIYFSQAKFLKNTYTDGKASNSSLLNFKTSSECLNTFNIVFNNVLFATNKLALLQVLSNFPANKSSITITTAGYYVVKDNVVSVRALMMLTNGEMKFNGITKFMNNSANQLIQAYSFKMDFSNATEF